MQRYCANNDRHQSRRLGSHVSGGLDSESTRQAHGFWESNMAHSTSNLRDLAVVLLSLMVFSPLSKTNQFKYSQTISVQQLM